MKSKAFHLTIAAAAAAALVTACGGGSSGGSAPASASGVVLSGTAATGLALANAPVTAACATGTATATTDARGNYTMTVDGGALPCLLQVTATVNGSQVALRSVAEAGTVSGTNTAARANITPLSELVVAGATGRGPAELAQLLSGGPASIAQVLSSLTTANLNATVTTVLAALKTATGVDFGSIDPLKASLTAATTTAPGGGDQFDKLLDSLGTKINTQSLPLIAAQVATNISGGASAIAPSLSTAPGCAGALSGKYRFVSLDGEVETATLDFGAMTIHYDGHPSSVAIAQNPNQACDFAIAEGGQFSEQASYRYAIGPQGAGAYHGFGSTDMTNGYMFPVQSAKVADMAGTWLLAQNGVASTETQPRVNWLSKLTIATTGAVTGCDYDDATSWSGACTDGSPDMVPQLVATTDGGVEVHEGADTTGRLWAFRSPAGTTTLYGSTAVSGSPLQTSLIATKAQALILPAAGTVNKSLNFRTVRSTLQNAFLTGQAPFVSTFTIQSPDSTAGTYVRTGTSEGTSQTQTLRINAPQSGLRQFAANTAAIQMPVAGSGLTLTFDAPSSPNFYRHIISVALP